MSGTAGRLMATLGLDARGFNKGIKDSEGRVQRFGRSVARVGVTLAAATAGLALSIGNAARGLVELDNLATVAGESAQTFKVLSLASRDVGIEQEKLADILKDVNDKFGDFAATGAGPLKDFFENIAPKVGVTQKAFEGLSSSDALRLYVSSLEKAGLSQQQMTFYMEALASDATALLPILTNGGAAIDAMALKAASLGLTLDQKTITAARKARREFEVISDVMRTRLQAALAGVLPVLTSVAEAFAPYAGQIANGLGRLASIAAVLAVVIGGRMAAALGGRYVGAAVQAVRQSIALEIALGATGRTAAISSLAVKGLAGALRILRGALIATGIGALVVGAGELVFWFGRLVKGAGGFGNALKLVKDLGVEVFDRIKTISGGAMMVVEGHFLSFKAEAVRVWADVVGGVVGAAEAIVDAGVGSAMAFKAAFQLLPAALGDLMFQAANTVVDGVEGMINAVILRINKFIETVNGALSLLPDWAGGSKISGLSAVDLGGVENPFAGAAEGLRDAAAGAYEAAQGVSDFGDRAGELEAKASGIDVIAAAARSAGEAAIGLSMGPLESLEAMRAAIKGTEEDMDDTAGAASRLQDAMFGLGGEGGGGSAAGKAGKSLKSAADKAKDAFKPLTDQIKSVSDTLAGAVVQGQNLGEAMKGIWQKMAQDLIASGLQALMMQIFGLGGGGGGNGLGKVVSSIFSVPAYAVGTNNHPGGLARINEEGGEIVTLPSGSKVMPADLSRRMATAASIGMAAAALPAVATSEMNLKVSIEASEDLRAVAAMEGGKAGQNASIQVASEHQRRMSQASKRNG